VTGRSWSDDRAKGREQIAARVADVRARSRLAVTGEIRSVAAVRHGHSIACRMELDDGTGTLALLFLGRGAITGVSIGSCLRVWGTAIPECDGFVVWNPRYEFAAPSGPSR
jgi:hypothetical protein